MSSSTRRGLRMAALAAAAIGTVFWLGVCARALIVPPRHRDGLEMAGAVLSTVYFLALVLPTIVLGLLDRWLFLAGLLGALVVLVAVGAVLPGIPWDLFSAGP